ncbi:unnamed protein product [Sympodiomycopsis kandeliae]
MPSQSSHSPSPGRHLSSKREQNIQNALARVWSSEDKPNIAQIAAEEGCHHSTLYRRLQRVHSGALEASNRMQKLTPDLEEVICDMVLERSRRYFPMPPSSIKWLAEQLLKSTGHPDPSLGRNWPVAFRKRHPQLSAKWSEIGAPGGTKVIKSEDISQYFRRLQNALQDKQIPYDQIYNMDETGFQLNEQSRQYVYTDRVANPRGFSRQLSQQNNITAVEVIRNSSDQPLPVPGYLIIKGSYAYLHENLFKKDVDYQNLRLIKTKTGFQSTHTMLDWLTFFIESTQPEDPNQWRLLLLDGYSGHKSIELEHKALTHKVLLFSMPPNATSLLQPLDVGVFLGLKREYKRILQSQLTNDQARLPIADFIQRYSSMRNKSMRPSVITQAFRRCGINSNALNPQRVLRHLNPEPRTPSPGPFNSQSPYSSILTPKSPFEYNQMVLQATGNSLTPRRREYMGLKLMRCLTESEGRNFRTQANLDASEARH